MSDEKKKSGKSHRSGQYGEEGTSKLYHYDPDKLVLIVDKNHPLYDERVHNKPDEAMVLNIMSEGVHENVIVRHNGKDDNGDLIVEVVAGRQRVICAREANKRLRAAGKQPVFVPCTLKRADEATMLGVLITENEQRREDSPMNKARKLMQYMALGRTEEQAALMFGVSKQTIKNWLKLPELHKDVQLAVDRGEVPMTVAKELADTPQEKQPEALAKLYAAGAHNGKRGLEAARNLRKRGNADSTTARMMTRTALEEWKKALKKMEGRDADVAYDVVSRILGNERALANYPKLRAALNPGGTE